MKLLLDENLSRRLVRDLADLFSGTTHVAKVIWLRGCDYLTAVAERLLRGQAVRISEFLKDRDQAVLILAP